MAVVVVFGITKQFGTQVVLQSVSLELRSGETVGLIGANGAGKTTLFRLIAGECQPDLGTITRARGLEIGYLKQEPEVSLTRTLHEEVGSVFADLLQLEQKLHAISEQMAAVSDQVRLKDLMASYDRVNGRFIAAGGHTFETRLNEIVGGLGFTQADHHLPMAVLSGGQKSRTALAKLLLQDRQLLLLDEPTNHLDIDAVRFLEKFLSGHRGGAVIISHDRYLLDRLCDRILEVERGEVSSFPGNYSNYAKTKEVRLLTRQRQFEKDQDFIEKERAFIAKHLAGQRTKEAQGRRTRLKRRMDAGEFVTDAPQTRRSTRLAFGRTETKGGTVLRCDELGMRYGDNVLFTDLTCQVFAGDSFGITGPNGTGKSTLLKIILSEISPYEGTVTLDTGRTVGYYAQEAVELDPERTVLDEIRAHRPELTEERARTMLGSYMFTGQDVFKKLKMLSGGEQSRVRLASLILADPEILILDEPTNHLDIPSCEVLEEALLNFGGTIIVVSHDRYFLDRIVDRLMVIRRGGHAIYNGNYSFYIEQVERQRVAARPRRDRLPFTSRSDVKGEGTCTPRRNRKSKGGAASRKRLGKQADHRKDSKSKTSPHDRLSIEELEKLVIEREVELSLLHERFGDQAVCKDQDALAELQEQADALSAELAELDTAWQERVDAQ